MQRLTSTFYSALALPTAPQLLGKWLCHALPDGTVLRGRITETEAYCGETDTGCHACRGKTPRNAVMYAAGGCSYIYLCYGIHALLNIVVGNEGDPQAVLLRSIQGAKGPGRLTRALQIDTSLNQVNLTTSTELWLEDDGKPPPKNIHLAPRVGLTNVSQSDRDALWNFRIA